MPPLRTIPAIKPVKTERTHEENQERAYIAASRRSDRSLEARVESARRASEIHKRRTGRSLRVTEQDVINEEMYEEEDDDLPMQYRRLTAHLQTTNADFDRRLAAYLTNHVAMRTALGAAVAENYTHPQYPNAPQFANQFSQFPQQNLPGSMPPPQMSPQNFSQSPYSMQQGYRPNLHARASSIATPHELQQQFQQQLPTPHSPSGTFKPEARRMSLPAQGMHSTTSHHARASPTVSTTSSTSSLANLKHEAAQQGVFDAGHQTSPSTKQSRPQMKIPNFPAPFSMGPDFAMNGLNMSPFTTTLPMESQQLLGPGLDPNDPFTAMLMGGMDKQAHQPFYSYNPNASSKPKGFNPPSTVDGMNQTLAPGMLDNSNAAEQNSYSTPTSATDSAFTPLNNYGGYAFEPTFSESYKALSSSGLTTPGEHDWASLIDSNVWEEPSSQPTMT